MERYAVKDPEECSILLVDDDKKVIGTLKEQLEKVYSFVEVCDSVEGALSALESKSFDVIVTELRFSRGSGMELIRVAKQKDHYVEIVVITGVGTLESASEAVNMGVTSYINKPFRIQELLTQVEKAVSSRLFHLRSMGLTSVKETHALSEMKEHIGHLTSLYYFSNKLMISLEVNEIMSLILKELIGEMEAGLCVIGVNYLNFHELYAMPAAGTIDAGKVVDTLRLHWDNSFHGFGAADYIDNEKIALMTLPGRKQESSETETWNWVLCLPLTILGESVGFAALFFKDNKSIEREKRQYLHVLVSLISSTTRHCYIDMLAKRQAKTDSLTGVANHRMFHEMLDREMARSMRRKRQFCLMMLDVDDFKRINDQYGHLLGDAVLQDLTRRLLHIIRKGDLLARYGGEEFSLILPDTGLEGATILAERMCSMVAATPYFSGDASIKYTISIGLAEYNSSYKHDKDLLIDRSDRALYKAKRSGKNRVEINCDNPVELRGEVRTMKNPAPGIR